MQFAKSDLKTGLSIERIEKSLFTALNKDQRVECNSLTFRYLADGTGLSQTDLLDCGPR